MRDVPRLQRLIDRPRLIQRIHDAMKARVCVITAPAGFGKTIALDEVRQNTAGAHVLVELNANAETFFNFLYNGRFHPAP